MALLHIFPRCIQKGKCLKRSKLQQQWWYTEKLSLEHVFAFAPHQGHYKTHSKAYMYTPMFSVGSTQISASSSEVLLPMGDETQLDVLWGSFLIHLTPYTPSLGHKHPFWIIHTIVSYVSSVSVYLDSNRQVKILVFIKSPKKLGVSVHLETIAYINID